jgi:hypothetical protein
LHAVALLRDGFDDTRLDAPFGITAYRVGVRWAMDVAMRIKKEDGPKMSDEIKVHAMR